MPMSRASLNRRLGYPRIKLRWLRLLAYRRFLDWYRASRFCRFVGSGMRTPLEATLRDLQLRGLLFQPLIALELFGGFGLLKTIDLAKHAEHITHVELHEALIHHAKKVLPAAKTHFVCTDAIRVVREGRLPRSDYNFIHIDNDCGRFGEYYENFDLFPQVTDYLGERGSLVFNVQLDIRDQHPDPAWLRRRQEFFGLKAGEDPAHIGLETARRAYLAHIPPERFAVLDTFPVPHQGETIYLVISLKRKA